MDYFVPALFNHPSNPALVARLKQKLTVHRDEKWTTYVNEASRMYQVPHKKMEEANKALNLNRYDRQFLLIQSTMEDITKDALQGNYGYVLVAQTNEVYLIIPHDPISFEQVKSAQQAERIRDIIVQKNDAIREASSQEMDDLLDICHKNCPEFPIPPEYLSCKKSPSFRQDGMFRSASHASNVYAYKRYVANSVRAQMDVEKNYRSLNSTKNRNPEQENAQTLLGLSWFSRAKENFSWEPLVDGLFGHSSRQSVVLNAMTHLDNYNKMVALTMKIETALNKEFPEHLDVKTMLIELKEMIAATERNNIFIELFLALAGIVAAPVALFIGLIWLVPAYSLNLPYMGKPQFLLDTLQWFADSLITAVQCLLFPLAMIQAHDNSGSMNLLKGECTRIVETLLTSVEQELLVLPIEEDVINPSLSNQALLRY